MDQEAKPCQNCKAEFTIEPEDFAFYEKIKVPPPTWCPECRLMRRVTWRNERSLYKRKCDLCGSSIISIYHPDSYVRVYCPKCWWSDNWDQSIAGRDYNFSKSFFEQFDLLFHKAPVDSLAGKNNVGTDYYNYASNLKDCYLVFSSIDAENGNYFARGLYVKDAMDIWQTRHSERCYETIECNKCFNLFFGQHCDGCSDSFFLYDCRNCSNCFGCVNLRSKQYCIFNQQYTKEEYAVKLKDLNLGSYLNFLKTKNDFQNFYLGFPRRYAMITKSVNAKGHNIANVSNCIACFEAQDEIKDCKYLVLLADRVTDIYDATYGGFGSEVGVENLGCVGNNLYFSGHVWYSYNVQYSHNCIDCHDLFACIGLRNKQYCILNKQYSKEEYEALVPKIIQQMNDLPYKDKKGRVYKHGEFFPPELSPFSYNETIAQEYFPLTKEEAIEKGYAWRDPEERNYQITMKTDQLPDHIKDAPDSILREVIECAHQGNCNEQCTTAFRIIPQELQFYRKMNLPLPRLCPNCRHYQRLKQRNPLKLWTRQCQCAGERSQNGVYQNTTPHTHGTNSCPNTFETSYSPDRPEIVYCEECYLKEVV
ncbi:MAG: hypothetical protein PHN39_03785 [Candidatus Pacebacteria bacterium]|nr:hypothetical protein [Candidatus Paceibacterota bacterium]